MKERKIESESERERNNGMSSELRCIFCCVIKALKEATLISFLGKGKYAQ